MGEQLPLLDTTCRPTAAAPPGAVPVGPPELCASCGMFSTPYSVLRDDPMSCASMFYNPDRRELLCLACTITTAKRLRAEGMHVDTALAWAFDAEVPRG